MKQVLIVFSLVTLFVFSNMDANGQGKAKGNSKNKNKVEKQKGPPAWAPAHGYRAKTRHIYFPKQNIYYDLQKGVYIYTDGKSWDVSVQLPIALKAVDLDLEVQVELDFDTDQPQSKNKEHQNQH